jgi:transcriptional regulator with XRE-family HTH domain
MAERSKSDVIKYLMQKNYLTIENLSQELGLSVSTINRLLVSSNNDPRLSTLKPIAKFFNISLDELVGEKPLQLQSNDEGHSFDNKNILLQVPVLHWEQVTKAKEITASLNFENWNHWTVSIDNVSQLAFALIIGQSSLGTPFYNKTRIIVEPEKKSLDSDYVLAIIDNNPVLTKCIINGMEKIYQSLNLEQKYQQGENTIIEVGTVVQWLTPHQEK